MLENTQLLVQLRGLFCGILRFKKIKEFIRKNSSSGPRENCLKHREYCFTLLEDSRGEIFGEWIIDLDWAVYLAMVRGAFEILAKQLCLPIFSTCSWFLAISFVF